MDEKIKIAREIVSNALRVYKNPIVMSSFGKDSMVLLHLLGQTGLRFPILFHREPFSPKKYEFANDIIRKNNYTVYDYAPLTTSVAKSGETIEIINHYQVGTKYSYLPTGIKSPKCDEEFLCGLVDIYHKPTGTFDFRWDCVFLGHKSTDVDPILGSIPLSVDVKQNEGSSDYIYPLRHFTDEDIWKYHKQFNVPINSKRYDQQNEFREFEDITYNNDYFSACTNCIDRDKPLSVFCPKLNMQINNISSEVRYIEAIKPPYLRETVAGTTL